MFDHWKLQDFDPGTGTAHGAHAETFDDAAWISVPAPGDVHRALIAAGRIPDPFFDRNEEACAWIEEREWWYRTSFDGPAASPRDGERLRLFFHGLDTFATVWLNGEELGSHANMFRPAIFDVTRRLRTGVRNVLAVRFDRPLDRVKALPIVNWDEREAPRSAMRKAQFVYGWDWGPRLPTIGIWRPVELARERRAVIAGIHPYTLEIAPQHEHALVAVRIEAERFSGESPLTAHLRLAAPADAAPSPDIEAVVPLEGSNGDLAGIAYLRVPRPRLWWTHGLGDPALYTLQVTLSAEGDDLDRRQTHVGIRTLTLDQAPDPDEPGTRFFRFVINGVPIFARGANWIPADSFVGAIPPERYERLLTAARDANMNMLRVWGGGLYEHDAFYDLCDRLGLLVWQDFMFACAHYPEQPSFADEVRAEAAYQIRRLRGHPSLALWCGNNENQWLYEMRAWDHPEARVSGALYYDQILPQLVARWDGHTPYWPGSPYGGDDYNSMADGDRHNWDVWHGNTPRRFGEQPRVDQSPAGVSFLRYAEDMGRFISEFGMHAAPVLETLRRAIPEDQLYHHSPSMDWHNKDNPKNKGDNLMLGVTGLPQNLDDYVDFSMIAQAEGLKFAVEHYRRRMPHCAGTLVWQLNDCWPVLSWSVLDYYGIGKAGYYYLARAYAPTLASFKTLVDGGLELWLTNDARESVEDTVEVRLARFDGEIIHQERRRVRVPALTSAPVAAWDRDALPGGPDRYLTVHSTADRFPTNRHFFVAIKDLQRVKPEVEVSITAVNADEARVELSSPHFAYFVHLGVADQTARFSDNYVDLLPGEARTITVSTAGAAPLTPQAIGVRWR
jgi:beta-mannosidase